MTTVDASSYFTEPDGQELSYAAASSDPSVITVSVSGTNVTIAATTKGTANVTITATDPGGLNASQTFQATVPNQAPQRVGTIPAQTVQVGDTPTLDVSQYFSDPDGDMLTYTASSSVSRVATVNAAGTSVTVTAIAKGTTDVTVTAADPDRSTASQTFRVTVPNRSPERQGTIPDQTITEGETETVNLRPYFTDPDGDMLSYEATSSNTSRVRVSVSGSNLSIRAVTPGMAIVTVTARDDEGATVQQAVRVTVEQANRAPQAVGTIPDQSLDTGEMVSINASQHFRDPDGDVLTFSASSRNIRVAHASVTGSTVRITAVAIGGTTVTITARDPAGLTAAQTVNVRVTQANRAPQRVGTIPSQTLGSGSSGTFDASRYFSDPDGDVLTYAAVSANNSISRATVVGTSVGFTGGAVGSTTITITVRDPGGLTATQLMRVGVVADTVFLPLTELTIDRNGRVSIGSTDIGTGCFRTPPGGQIIDDTVWEIHWSEWQYRPRAAAPPSSTTSRRLSWVSIPGTRKDGEICGHADLGDDDARSGDYRIVGEFSKDRSRNRYRSGHVTIGSPDLTVTASPSSVTVNTGDTIRVQWTIRNSGGATAPATTGRLLRSSNRTITTTDAEESNFRVRSLRSGLWQGYTIERVPSEPGSYWLGVCVDPVAGESNTANNCSAGVQITIRASGSPDLVFTDVEPEALAVSPGDTVRATFTLRNRGTAEAAATTVRAFTSDDAGISRTDREVGRGSIAAIPAGGSSRISFALALPTDLSSMTFYAGLCADPVAGESNTANNCSRAIRIVVSTDSGAPDLFADDVSPTVQTVSQGDTATAEFFLGNGGSGPSPATTVRILTSNTPGISTTDRQIGTFSMPGLSAQERYTLSVDWILASNQPLGRIYWGVCIDPVAGESDTTNNCSPSVELTVVAASAFQGEGSVLSKVLVSGHKDGSGLRSLSDWLPEVIIRSETTR